MNLTRLAVLAFMLLALGACVAPDRGRCLSAHDEIHPTSTAGTYTTETVCNEWEFPNGV